MYLPLIHTVFVRKTDGVGLDRHGNEILGKTPPIPVQVAGWYIPSTDEQTDSNHDARVTTDLVLYAPPEIIGQHDEVMVERKNYRVVSVSDYSHGPWWGPGLEEYRLRRVTG